MKSIMEMRSANRLDAAIEFACQTVGKSRCDLLPGDFHAARQRAARTNQRALVEPLERLATLGELVDSIRKSGNGRPDDTVRPPQLQ